MRRIHVLHLLYRFAAGGMENVIVQLINHLPHDKYRHTVVALTTADPDFARRIAHDDVAIIELNKPPGQPFKLYPRFYRLLKDLRPDVQHSGNLAALEFQVVAWAAAVPRRIHAEHGWDIADPDGSNQRYRLLRKLHQRFVHEFIAVSPQLYHYLSERVGIQKSRLHLIPNGVDTDRFRPAQPGDPRPEGFPFSRPDHFVIGTVGRLEPIKNQILLAQAFVELVQNNPDEAGRLRLAIIGDGPLKNNIGQILREARLDDRLWMPGSRTDIPEILRAFDCFVLPSLAEGTSCTLQEAMATGLPIVVTDVGGNSDLLAGGKYGKLVPLEGSHKIAQALMLAMTQGVRNLSARQVVCERYGIMKMMTQYDQLFRTDVGVDAK